MKKIIALVGLLCLAVSAVYASVWADVQITGYSQRKEAADKVAERLDFEQKVALSLKAADSKVQEDIAAMKKAAGQKELSLEQQAQIEHKRAIYALNALLSSTALLNTGAPGFESLLSTQKYPLLRNWNEAGASTFARHASTFALLITSSESGLSAEMKSLFAASGSASRKRLE